MNIQEELETTVARHNRVVDQIAALTEERQKLLGRAELLTELAKFEGENGAEATKADEAAN